MIRPAARGRGLAELVSTATNPNIDDGEWGILLVAGAVGLTAATCLIAAFVDGPTARLASLVIALAVVAELLANSRAALGCAVLAFALGDGFLQGSSGQLTWQASVDYPYLLGLLGAVALGLSVAQIRLARQRRRQACPFAALLDDATGRQPPVAPGGLSHPVVPDGRRRPDAVPGVHGHALRNHKDRAMADVGKPTVEL